MFIRQIVQIFSAVKKGGDPMFFCGRFRDRLDSFLFSGTGLRIWESVTAHWELRSLPDDLSHCAKKPSRGYGSGKHPMGGISL